MTWKLSSPKQKLSQPGWEVLIHPPYSPNIAPSDFHLFLSLQNYLNGKNFNSQEDCKRHLKSFFAQKDIKFWEGEIIRFPEICQEIVKQNFKDVVQQSSK